MNWKNPSLILVIMATAALTVAAPADNDPGAVVDRYFEAYRSMDPGRLAALYAPDAVLIDVLQKHRTAGREAIRQNVAQLAALHTKLGAREEQRVVSGNNVAVKFVYTGTVSGEALRQLTGKTTCRDTDYEIAATAWFEISDGQVVRQTDFIDVTALKEAQARASGEGHQ